MPRRTAAAAAPAIQENARNRIDAVTLLRGQGTATAALAFFDPQYREVLDKLAFGNEGARQGDRSALPQMTPAIIAAIIIELERALKPSGYLVLWMDKYCLVQGRYRDWLDAAISMKTVDMLSWNKMRPGMGRRLRGVMEFAVILQKVPIRAAGTWHDHSLNDGWSEHSDRSIHPHAKPHQLTQRLIRATTKRGDLVIDPAAGGFGVLEACKETGRRFVGGDIME